jgi:hypothetical protein
MVMVGVWLLLLLLRRLRLLLDGVNNLLHQFNLLRSNLHPPTLVATGANSQLRLLKVRQQLNHLDGVPLLKVSKAHLLMVLRKHNPLDGVQLLPLPLLNLVWPNLLLAGVLRRLPSLNLPSLPADGVLQLRLPPTTTMDGALIPVVVQHGKLSSNTSRQRWPSRSTLLSLSICQNVDW